MWRQTPTRRRWNRREPCSSTVFARSKHGRSSSFTTPVPDRRPRHKNMSLLLISSTRFVEHQTPPGHPERPERAEVMDVIADRWRQHGGEVAAPGTATVEQLARVHDGEYVRRIAETAGR